MFHRSYIIDSTRSFENYIGVPTVFTSDQA